MLKPSLEKLSAHLSTMSSLFAVSTTFFRTVDDLFPTVAPFLSPGKGQTTNRTNLGG
jgi:hypothetical protein